MRIQDLPEINNNGEFNIPFSPAGGNRGTDSCYGSIFPPSSAVEQFSARYERPNLRRTPIHSKVSDYTGELSGSLTVTDWARSRLPPPHAPRPFLLAWASRLLHVFYRLGICRHLISAKCTKLYLAVTTQFHCYQQFNKGQVCNINQMLPILVFVFDFYSRPPQLPWIAFKVWLWTGVHFLLLYYRLARPYDFLSFRYLNEGGFRTWTQFAILVPACRIQMLVRSCWFERYIYTIKVRGG